MWNAGELIYFILVIDVLGLIERHELVIDYLQHPTSKSWTCGSGRRKDRASDAAVQYKVSYDYIRRSISSLHT